VVLVILERAVARPLLLASVLASVACTGGEAAVPSLGPGSVVPAAPDGGSSDDAGDAGTTGPGPCDDAGDRGDGSTFSDLYRDFFGPTGLASCGARSICHVPGGTGAQTSGGYVCAPDQATCWATMTRSIVPDGGTSAAEGTTLYMALRKAPPTPGSGPMPRNSAFAFCPNDLERIKTWIASGATND
jgi:hypothetical protein